uniref:Peptidase S1 domain-containing protein n=1 Tax=Glossina palpalis gambiensis TaxID=67801 RepID=A0A1B0B3S6_9MUSC
MCHKRLSNQAGECNLDRSELRQTLALVKCKEIHTASETSRTGVIITNNFVLTASVLPEDDVSCVITYNINGEGGEQTAESSSIRSYAMDSNINPHVLPQLQLLGLNAPINFELPGPNITLAKTIKLAKQSPEIDDNVLLHTIRKRGNKYDVVQMEVNFASRNDCKKENLRLHPYVFCITIAKKECDGCNNVMAGSALVQNNELIGIVSERVTCDPSKRILCADVYEVRNWIKSTVGIRETREWSLIYRLPLAISALMDFLIGTRL